MKIYAWADIELRPGDRVVAATAYRDYIFVVTEQGAIFKVLPEEGL